MSLTVKIISAILTRDTQMFSRMDPYVLIQCGKQKQKTHTHNQGGKKPQWGQTFIFKNPFNLIKFIVMDQDTFTDDIIGTVNINIKKYVNDIIQHKEYLGLQYKGKPAGKLYVAIQYKGNLQQQQQNYSYQQQPQKQNYSYQQQPPQNNYSNMNQTPPQNAFIAQQYAMNMPMNQPQPPPTNNQNQSNGLMGILNAALKGGLQNPGNNNNNNNNNTGNNNGWGSNNNGWDNDNGWGSNNNNNSNGWGSNNNSNNNNNNNGWGPNNNGWGSNNNNNNNNNGWGPNNNGWGSNNNNNSGW